MKNFKNTMLTILILQLALLPVTMRQTQAADLKVETAVQKGLAKIAELEKHGWTFYDADMNKVTSQKVFFSGTDVFYLEPGTHNEIGDGLLLKAASQSVGSQMKINLSAYRKDDRTHSLANTIWRLDLNQPSAKNQNDNDRALKLFQYKLSQAFSLHKNVGTQSNRWLARVFNLLFPSAQAADTLDLNQVLGVMVMAGIMALTVTFACSFGDNPTYFLRDFFRWKATHFLAGAILAAVIIGIVTSILEKNAQKMEDADQSPPEPGTQ